MKTNKKLTTIIIMIISVLMLTLPLISADQPLLKASLSKYEPTPAEPGQYVDVYITLQNTGNGDAPAAQVEFVPQYPFSIVDPADGKVLIGILGGQKDYVAKFKVKIDASAVEGETPIKFKYTTGQLGDPYQEKEFSISIRSFDANIDITSVKTLPETISPGTNFKVTLSLENTAKSSLKDISLSLDLEKMLLGTTLIDLPFAPVGTSVNKRIDLLAPDESKDISFDLITYPTVTSGVYKLPITITFHDTAGTKYTKTGLITLIIQSKPDLLVTIDESALSKQVTEGEVSFSITNKGFDSIKYATITLEQTQDFEIMSTSNQLYIGKIDSDDFETVTFKIKMNKAADQIVFPLKLNFKDSNNNDYTQEFKVTQNIYASNGGQKGGSSFWIIGVVVIIGIALFFYFRSKKTKK